MPFFTVALILAALLASSEVKADEPDITINHLTDEQENNVRSFLSLTQESCDAPMWRVRNLFTKADKEISNALRALGYYQIKLDKQLLFVDECWAVTFNLTLGDPIIIDRFSVKVVGGAEKEVAFKQLLADVPIKTGDVLNHGLYEQVKQDLQSLALQHGFLKNQMIKKGLHVDIDSHRAEIELVFDSGARHHFGEIVIEQAVLSPDFVTRFLDINTNEYYSSEKLARTYNTLASSLYFSGVNITPQTSDIKNNEVPVLISLIPEKKHHYSFGLGYDTDVGPLASAGYQNRIVNQVGHNLSFELDVSPVISGMEASYMIPITRPRTDHVLFGMGYKREAPDTFKSKTLKLSFQYQHTYAFGLKQTLFTDLSHEDFTISGNSEGTGLFVPGVRWEYKESNDVLRPTKGYMLDFSVAGAHEEVLSDLSFLQITASAKMINSLPWYARVISRVNLGGTLTDDFSHLPVSYRFFSGGSESIRGFDYKDLGPTDSAGDVTGGKALTIISVEYEQFINKAWGVAAFIDSGNAYNPDDIQVRTGIGMGLRWLSPIGPIRLDVAVPLGKYSSSFQIHFSAGSHL